MYNTVPFKELETAGFVVIRNFLTNEEIKPFLDEYNTVQNYKDPNGNYQLNRISYAVVQTLESKLQSVLKQVAACTNINADLLLPAGTYADTAKINFPWHQDYEDFYIFQQTYNYLNFYIPIVKPLPDQTGICVLPFDKLASVSPTACSQLINNGSSNLFINNGVTEVAKDNPEENFIIDADIETIKETPTLNVGDLLLLRGDTVHRTQDNNTKRIAISIRATNGDAMINKFKITNGTGHKLTMINRNRQFYDYVCSLFGPDNENTAREMISRFIKGLK